MQCLKIYSLRVFGAKLGKGSGNIEIRGKARGTSKLGERLGEHHNYLSFKTQAHKLYSLRHCTNIVYYLALYKFSF